MKTTVNIALKFNGNCEAAFNFYKAAFGKEFSCLHRYKDMSAGDCAHTMSEEDKQKILHMELPISDETCLMGCDDFGRTAVFGNNFTIAVLPENRIEADRLYSALSTEGQVHCPIGETFWGAYYSMFTDKFNINWEINFDLKK